MKRIKRPAVYSLFLVIFLLNALPAPAEPDQKTPTLGTVVVTATKEETPFETGDVETEESTGFISVIQRADFEGKMENLADVLQNEAAVQVRQSGGLGSFSTISIRGSSSDQVMVFMDGVLLNDASGGGVDLSAISLSDVESIEIYRGVTPVNFDKASIGGVVNIKTLRAKEGVNASVSAGYGSFDTKKASAFVNQKSGKWDYLVSAGYMGSHNDFKILNNNGTEWNPDDDRWETRNNAQFDQGNILGKFGYDFTDDLRIGVVNQWFSKDQGLPSWDNSPKTNASFNTQRNITTLSVIANNLGPLALNTRTSIDYSHKNELYDDSRGQIGLGKQKTRYITDRYGGNFFVEWMADWNIMSFMADFHQENYAPENLLNDRPDPNQSSRDTLSFGLQDSLLLFEDALNITPAVRYTHIHDKLKSATTLWGAPLEGKETNESYWSPQIGLKYSPLDWFSFKGNLARYVREPSFFEMFGDRGFVIGNPNLQAEKGVNFDGGVEVNWLSRSPWFQRVSLSAAYFGSDVEDLITFVYDSRGIGKAENISRASIRGVESRLTVDFLKFFRFIGNATWQDPLNESDVKAFNGKVLPGRWQTSYLGRLEGSYAGFKAFGECIRETGMYYDSANLLPAEDKTLINAGISWLFHSFLFSVEGTNLGDRLYEDFNGYPMPGRAFYFTVGYRY